MTIEERVISVIKENSENIEEIPVAADLQEDIGIDSFGTLMIINGIEDEFEISINEEDAKAIRSVSDIVTILKQQYRIEE